VGWRGLGRGLLEDTVSLNLKPKARTSWARAQRQGHVNPYFNAFYLVTLNFL